MQRPGQSDIGRAVAQLLEYRGDDVSVERLSGGASRDTWRVDVAGRSLVLQCQRPGATADMAAEAEVLRAAHRWGVAVPEVVAAGEDEGFGAPYLLVEAVPGETIARRILRDDAFAAARDVIVGQFGTELARLHAVPVDEVTRLEASDELAQYRRVYDTFAEPHPTFELALRWLDTNRPSSGALSLVHGDFRLGNIMIDETGVRAVLDWELAHLGDPMEDLGWLCVRAWRFGGDSPVAGIGTREELARAYEAAGGAEVDLDIVHWWEVLGTLKWGIICIMQAQSHLRGLVRSHELAAIGRRVCETEYDLFLALEGRW
jgi:aminoglycoside phosphotransferase (APT) family kinase protein